MSTNFQSFRPIDIKFQDRTSILQKTLISRDLESSAKIVEELKANRVQGTKQKGIDPLEKSLIEVRAQLHQVINFII